jgi:hypothetical protein
VSFSLRVTHNGLDGLERDLRALPAKSVKDMKAKTREAGIVGNTLARDNARVSSGTHGKLYPRSFTHEEATFAGFGGFSFSTTYGPDASRPQGGMSFEWGSRNQTKPHLDLNRSADIMGPSFAREVRGMVDAWFW